ncbi:MAG: ABC transporter permease [Cyanobacteria bacterium J06639_1]
MTEDSTPLWRDRLAVGAAKTGYVLEETWLGLRRGGWLNWAAISTLAVLLFAVGASLQVSWQLDDVLQSLGDRAEISVYLEPNATHAELRPIISRLSDVVQVRVIDRDTAWRELADVMGATNSDAIAESLGGNPLVDTLRVRAKSAAALPVLAAAIARVAGVADVQYGSEAIARLEQLRNGLQLGAMAVTGGLAVAAVAVVTTTIRLIAIARRREIEVMQLVGATERWIYLPFFLQGACFGVVGALGAWGLTRLAQHVAGNVLAQVFAMPLASEALSTSSRISLPLVLVVSGISLGAMSSFFAVRQAIARRA